MRALQLLVVLSPSLALAGDMTNALGFAGQWSASTAGYARALFPALLLVAFIVEIVFRDPSSPPSFRNSVWRGAIVLALVMPVGGQTLYGALCGALAGLSDGMAATLAPSDPWADFARVAEQWQERLAVAKAGNEDGSIAAQVGGVFFASLLSLALLLGQSAMWVMTQLASVLVVLLYALGPLALVFWLPLKSDSFGRWLRTFLTVLTWPVMSAVILGIITKASLRGLDGASPAFATLATALLLGVTALAVPVVSSSLVGGSMGAISAGVSTLMQTAGLGAAVGSTALGGAVGATGGAIKSGDAVARQGGGVLADALAADGPMSSGPPARGGPRIGPIIPNAIDAAPIHGRPAVEQDGLALGAPASTNAVGAMHDAVERQVAGRQAGPRPPPPPADAFSGRLDAQPQHRAPQGSQLPPQGPTEPRVGAPPARRRLAPVPAEEQLTAPAAKPSRQAWEQTLDRLGWQAQTLANEGSSADERALRTANGRLDRAVAAAGSGLSVDDWERQELLRADEPE